MRQAILLLAFATAFLQLFSFTACTRASSAHTADAEGFAGNKPKYFYNQVVSGQIAGVSVDADKKQAKHFSIISSGISAGENIDYSAVQITQDGNYLTIKGDIQIYEFNVPTPDKVAAPGFLLPPTSIDTLCVSSAGRGELLGGTGFSEVRSYPVNGGYNLVGIGTSGTQSLFESNPIVTRADSGVQVTYLANNLGLHIQTQKTSASDPTYFQSYIDEAVSSSIDWASASAALVCHLNIPSSHSHILVSSTAKHASIYSPMNGTTSLNNAMLANDGGAMASSVAGAGSDPTDEIMLTGYFSDPTYALPLNALINGIKINCSWQASPSLSATGSTYEWVKIVKASTPLATKTTQFAIPSVLTLSPDYGSNTDLWGNSWTPSQINASDFGLSVSINGWGNSVFGLDYCQMSVYWSN